MHLSVVESTLGPLRATHSQHILAVQRINRTDGGGIKGRATFQFGQRGSTGLSLPPNHRRETFKTRIKPLFRSGAKRNHVNMFGSGWAE